MRSIESPARSPTAMAAAFDSWAYMITQPGRVRDISFRLPPGARLGLAGGSGSGKSTLGRALVRLLEPSSGAIRFDGTDITHLSEAELRAWGWRIPII